jgi:hypothetical protein
MKSDGAWKEAIRAYFREFMYLFFSDIAREIDFGRGYEFLDKEFERIVQDANIKKRLADMLVRVYLKDGSQTWLFIHIEVQGYYEKDFAKRMYIYNYRIFDRYGGDVISLAILADEHDYFRPDRFEKRFCGFELMFRFPVVKILDYESKWDYLAKVDNPFAVIVMAHLKLIETKQESERRVFWKVSLVKQLYDKGYSKEEILLLYRFIDWLLVLPEEINRRFHEEIIRYEEEKRMPYITTAERIGMEKGIQQGIQQGTQLGSLQTAREMLLDALEESLQGVSEETREIINSIEDRDVLKKLFRKSMRVQTEEEFREVLKTFTQ